jgi:hypothetical protein
MASSHLPRPVVSTWGVVLVPLAIVAVVLGIPLLICFLTY